MTITHTPDKAQITFKRVFSAAHRLWNDTSKCHNIHGHNFKVWVMAYVPRDSLSAQGFIIPFDEIKRIIDNLDHKLILAQDDPILEPQLGVQVEDFIGDGGIVVVPFRSPSTENLAKYLADEIKQLLPPIASVKVTVRETDNIEAEAWA